MHQWHHYQQPHYGPAIGWLEYNQRILWLLCRQGQAGAPKYSRLEADISAMQRSSSTYCDQPEDTQDFEAWLKVRCPFDTRGQIVFKMYLELLDACRGLGQIAFGRLNSVLRRTLTLRRRLKKLRLSLGTTPSWQSCSLALYPSLYSTTPFGRATSTSKPQSLVTPCIV